MDAPVAVADPRLADLSDSQLEIGLLAMLGLVSVEGAIDLQSRTGLADRYLPGLSHLIDKPTFAGRPQSFFARTSWSIALSRLRSATIRLSLAFSSSSCRKRLTSVGINPA